MSDPAELVKSDQTENHTESPNTTQRKEKIEDYFARDEKNQLSRSVQVNMEGKSLDGDISLCLQSNNYWFLQAEKTRKELELALMENERLCQLKATLKEENLYYRQMLDEVQSFMEVYKEVVDDAANDTGIELAPSDESQESC